MAKYILPKFRWHSMHQVSRYASSKVELVPVSNRLAAPTSTQDKDIISRDHNDGFIRYNVCKDRSKTSRKFLFDRRNVQKKLAGLQDEYDILPPEDPAVQRVSAGASKPAKAYRSFTASTTYKNVTLPLKSSKLANPFPEPVKLMPSHTVSDREKADQMQAEFRVPKFCRK